MDHWTNILKIYLLTYNKTMQVKKSFDQESLTKMLKGALIAFTGAGAISLLNYIGALQLDNPVLTSLVAWGVPTLINVIKEWMKGE